MRDNPSLADQAVFTLGEIERMADDIDDSDPMRHTVRKMKRTAEQAVIGGLQLAQEIADSTRQMRLDAKVSNIQTEPSSVEQPGNRRIEPHLDCQSQGLSFRERVIQSLMKTRVMVADQHEWEVRFSKTDNTRHSDYAATICAANEDEVRALMSEKEPDKNIDEIRRRKRLMMPDVYEGFKPL